MYPPRYQSAHPGIPLTIPFKIRIIFQDSRRSFVRSIIMNISPSNILAVMSINRLRLRIGLNCEFMVILKCLHSYREYRVKKLKLYRVYLKVSLI